MTLTTLTATQFVASVDSASARIALVNRDGYPVAQYTFADVEEAKFFYTEAQAVARLVYVDGRRGFTKVAPVVTDGEGNSYGLASEAFEVMDSELVKVPGTGFGAARVA